MNLALNRPSDEHEGFFVLIRGVCELLTTPTNDHAPIDHDRMKLAFGFIYPEDWQDLLIDAVNKGFIEVHEGAYFPTVAGMNHISDLLSTKFGDAIPPNHLREWMDNRQAVLALANEMKADLTYNANT